jgi:hypothetical protein
MSRKKGTPYIHRFPWEQPAHTETSLEFDIIGLCAYVLLCIGIVCLRFVCFVFVEQIPKFNMQANRERNKPLLRMPPEI